jgi:hypothetical protein
VIAPLSFLVANLIIYWAGWNTLWRLGLAIILGHLLLGGYSWYATARKLPNAPALNWRAAQWLPPYLIGMGVISWQGGFGTGAQRHIPLWWDIALISAFSLMIYYWARRVALPAPEIERAIEHGARDNTTPVGTD